MADDAASLERSPELRASDARTGVLRLQWAIQEAQDEVRAGRRVSRQLVRLICESVEDEAECEDRHRRCDHKKKQGRRCGMASHVAGGQPTDETKPPHAHQLVSFVSSASRSGVPRVKRVSSTKTPSRIVISRSAVAATRSSCVTITTV